MSDPATYPGTLPALTDALAVRTCLPDIWPETLLVVPTEDREVAAHTLRAPLRSAHDADLAGLISACPDALCFAITDGECA